GDGVALKHGYSIHDPGHRLRVGVDIGGGDVNLGADDGRDLGRVAARQALELRDAVLFGVDDDAALGAAVGDAHRGALPGHPHGEGLYLVQGHVRVIADTALRRAAGQRVLHAVAGEHPVAPIVHAHREVHG